MNLHCEKGLFFSDWPKPGGGLFIDCAFDCFEVSLLEGWPNQAPDIPASISRSTKFASIFFLGWLRLGNWFGANPGGSFTGLDLWGLPDDCLDKRGTYEGESWRLFFDSWTTEVAVLGSLLISPVGFVTFEASELLFATLGVVFERFLSSLKTRFAAEAKLAWGAGLSIKKDYWDNRRTILLNCHQRMNRNRQFHVTGGLFYL